MKIDARLGAVCAASLCLCGMLLPSAATAADPDSCALLTPAQIGSAVGVQVGDGKRVAATSVKTCTWTPTTKSDVTTVTVFSQPATAYDTGKQATSAANGTNGVAVKSARVGDDGYFLTIGAQASLFFKKGSSSFKVTVYAKLPVDKQEAMELALAKQVITKL
jgi:hypothetical protein